MAIIFDNKYNKIVKSVVNFEDETTEVEMRVYSSKTDRDREKNIKDSVNLFCERVQQFLIDNISKLVSETNKIQPVDTITNREEFLALHPSIKEILDEQEDIQKEGLFLMDKILIQDIDISNLKYIDVWKSFGLTSEMCKKVDIIGSMSITIDGIKENKLTNLYDALKTKIVSVIEDC